ncbi:hypothetical protein DFH07DRAFT_997523 [Mycena maculata]|uniref:SAP domain-containing protein n=1 Tax=Mycena maculata TaxID=230809 RepID=A0AAD7KEV0_9AGAR|nr:hypothetical protein DFH07DRAFT_997523 [Mycena maculata]
MTWVKQTRHLFPATLLEAINNAIGGSVGVARKPSSLSHIDPGAALLIVPLGLFPLCELCVLVVVSACRHWSVMPKDVSNSNTELPFPGEYGPNGFAIQYLRLGSFTNSELSEHCKTFKLAYSGNKTTLTSRLTEFSKDKSLWESLIPGTTNAHKGPRKSEKKTKSKGSSLRRQTLFDGAAGVRVLNAPITERSRTTEEKAAILPWAQRIVAKYPYKLADAEPQTNPSLYISPPTTVDQSHTTNVQSPDPMQVLAGLWALLQQPQNSGDATAAGNISTVALSSGAIVPNTVQQQSEYSVPSTIVPVYPPAVNSMPSMSPSTVDEPHDTSNESPTRTLKMAGGKLLTFRECDIPDPPAVSYAKSIENLSTAFLSLLPTVYKYWKGTQWKGVKKTWFDWKILVRAMSKTSLEDFWMRYSVIDKSGAMQRMKYTPLLTQLSKERKVENEKLAEVAQRELTSEQLTYRKGADHFVMTKPSMIAAYYRKLKGLEVEEDGDEDY